jgi:hypothetical protein
MQNSGLILNCLWSTVTIPDIIYAINTLDFYNVRYCQKPNISARLIIFVTLAQIWKAYFRFIFDEESLILSHILTIIREDARGNSSTFAAIIPTLLLV